MTSHENQPPLPDWRIPVVHCCGLALPADDLACPACGEYLDPRIRHIDPVA